MGVGKCRVSEIAALVAVRPRFSSRLVGRNLTCNDQRRTMEDDELQAIRAARMAELRGSGSGGASSGGPSAPSGKSSSLPTASDSDVLTLQKVSEVTPERLVARDRKIRRPSRRK